MTRPAKVVFLIDTRVEFAHEVVAFFPDMPDAEYPNFFACFTIADGQDVASKDWFETATRPATPDEYAPLHAFMASKGIMTEIAA